MEPRGRIAHRCLDPKEQYIHCCGIWGEQLVYGKWLLTWGTPVGIKSYNNSAEGGTTISSKVCRSEIANGDNVLDAYTRPLEIQSGKVPEPGVRFSPTLTLEGTLKLGNTSAPFLKGTRKCVGMQ